MLLSIGHPTHLLEPAQRTAFKLAKYKWTISLRISSYFPLFLPTNFIFLKITVNSSCRSAWSLNWRIWIIKSHLRLLPPENGPLCSCIGSAQAKNRSISVWLQPSVPAHSKNTKPKKQNRKPTPILSSHNRVIINFLMNHACPFLATSDQCEKKLENYAHSQAKTQLKYKNYFLLRDET